MKTVAIVGFGTMGRAIGQTLNGSYQVMGLDQGDDLGRVQAADFVILAVKPQVFDDLSEQLGPFLDHQIVISIMAGIRGERISRQLSIDSLVRTMPNLGVANRSSVTAAYVFGQADKAATAGLLDLWGATIWLDKESDFDGFTAIAGCGPAYFFELTHQLQQAAEKLGFEQGQARKIANGTLVAAASILDDDSAGEKVRQVASKGGATEAALKVFEEHQLGHTIDLAVQAARARSEELSQ
jgi:pyrroline-5-carboxylate reductase